MTHVVARAPGRVNLLGDHTDYTGGWCVPMAIDRWVTIAGDSDPGDRTIEVTSDEFAGTVCLTADLPDPAQVEPAWGRYVAAVASLVRPAAGLRAEITTTIPAGRGLSSSAALEVATALALGADPADRLALARLCQRAEQLARNVPTGILDQMSSLYGVAGHALLLDCTTLDVVPVGLPDGVQVAVVSNGQRLLEQSGYATRVAELARVEAQIGPLRVAMPAALDDIADPVLRRRARHVVTENARVREFVAALRAGDVAAAGEIMSASHASLRDDYESSTASIDRRCAALLEAPGVLGARITGGGWGGSIVALGRPGAFAGIADATVVAAVDGATVDAG